MVLVNSPMILANSIVWGNTGAALIVQGTDIPVVRYCNVTGNWPGLGNGDVDPCFAAWGTWVDVLTGEPVAESSNPEFAIWRTGDYHVQSQAGRWDPEAWTWVVDTVTSPCIDGGDPGDAIGIEPIPTGEIVNMGVYGATNQASRSYITDRPAPFKEPRLKEVVENVLGIFDPTPADLLDLTDLDQIAEGQIYFHSLSGIEPAINLRTLKLDEHGLRETSWLSGLTNLKSLNISDQFVGTTLDGLQELVHLEYLNIHRSQIYDLRPLAGLTQLRTLIVNRNNLYGDLESLRNLTQLEWLDVRGNNLSDLSALEDMTHLKRLIIYDNLWTDQEAILDQIRSNNPGIVIDE
jgi:hypothetical protein